MPPFPFVGIKNHFCLYFHTHATGSILDVHVLTVISYPCARYDILMPMHIDFIHIHNKGSSLSSRTRNYITLTCIYCILSVRDFILYEHWLYHLGVFIYSSHLVVMLSFKWRDIWHPRALVLSSICVNTQILMRWNYIDNHARIVSYLCRDCTMLCTLGNQ